MISGGVKFFTKSKTLFSEGCNASASSNTEAAKYILSLNNYTEWKSLGSNDTIDEEILIELSELKSISRIILTDMNFKDFLIQYFDGADFVDFTNVISANGISRAKLEILDNEKSAEYFEFDEVDTTQIKLIIRKTIVPNEEKYLCKFIATSEIGTLKGFPRVDNQINSNEVESKTMSGFIYSSKGFQTAQIKINFKTHPYGEDISLIEYLFSIDESFLIYPCGGRFGDKYFKMNQFTWKLGDIYNVKTSGNLDADWEKGVYLLGANKNITFKEHI